MSKIYFKESQGNILSRGRNDSAALLAEPAIEPIFPAISPADLAPLPNELKAPADLPKPRPFNNEDPVSASLPTVPAASPAAEAAPVAFSANLVAVPAAFLAV